MLIALFNIHIYIIGNNPACQSRSQTKSDTIMLAFCRMRWYPFCFYLTL